MTKTALAVLFCGLFLLSCSQESSMENERTFDQMMQELAPYEPGHRLNQFKQRIGYDEAIKNEKHDGLIDIDFMKLQAPPGTQREWTFEKEEYLYFRWKIESTHAAAGITAVVHENYGDAQEWFITRAESSTMAEIPWIACSKKLGTVCAQSDDKDLIFFAYKNVMIEVTRSRCEPGHEGFTEVVAEWLFDALKAAPLKPMLR